MKCIHISAKLKPDKIYIHTDDIDLSKYHLDDLGEFIIVQTSGGAQSRRYKHMDMVINNIGYNVVQIDPKATLLVRKQMISGIV